jgi:hypothetical protein
MNIENQESYTDKKNQHYIPKFYLRNFSYKKNGKQIGFYNIKADKFFQSGKLKTQGSKSFFYGKDGIIENTLSKIEGEIAQTIQEIINTQELPPRDTIHHGNILVFVALTHLRNPVIIESIKEQSLQFEKLMNLDLPKNVKKFTSPEMTHEHSINLSLSMLPDIVDILRDLEYKIIINETSTPFIASDFPVVKYNQFLEFKKWPHGRTGYGTVGLQIFIPLSPSIVLLLFDSNIYKVSDKKKHKLKLTNITDIRQINALQLLNCFESIFFNEEVNELYVRSIVLENKKFIKPNQVKSSLAYMRTLKDPIPSHKNLLVVGSTDLETRLKISGINLHSKSKKYVFNPSVAQLRPIAKEIVNNRRNTSHKQGFSINVD